MRYLAQPHRRLGSRQTADHLAADRSAQRATQHRRRADLGVTQRSEQLPDLAGPCIYISDTGDNLRKWPNVVVYAFPEPDVDADHPLAANDSASQVWRFPIKAEDGPIDVEAFIVLPDATAMIFYEKASAAARIFKYTAPWTPDNSMLSEQEKADGFVSLFDGKTLNGWWFYGKNKEGFAVEDGAIVWKAIGGEALYSHERYDNFILRLQWKINKGGNSGIYLRAPRAGRQSKTGMEFQLQGDYGDTIKDDTTGAIYVVVPPKVNATKPEGEWNDVEIMLNGPMMKATLNGQVVQDLNLDENPELKKRLKRGFIGLQDHARFVAFKNIRIKKH
jgi:hypothetical protein